MCSNCSWWPNSSWWEATVVRTHLGWRRWGCVRLIRGLSKLEKLGVGAECSAGKGGVFQMQRGLIRATIGWTDRAQDLLQRAGPGQQRPAGSCSAWRAIEPDFRGVMGEALLWGPGGHFNPLLLGQEIKRFLLYFSKFPAASCFAATADSLGFNFFTMKHTMRNTGLS